MPEQSSNLNLSSAARARKLSPAQLSALTKARAAKLAPPRHSIDNGQVPVQRLGRLFRAHVKSCPFRPLGRVHTECECPIYLGEGKDSDGKKINQRSLHTNYWPLAQERLTALENGALLESIGGLTKLFRKHEKSCPYFGKGGIGHRDCGCTVWMRCYGGASRYGGGKRAAPSLTRSLYTSDWQHASDLANDIENGASVEMIQLLGRLFRQHEKSCPFYGKRGVSYLDCNCTVWTSAYKGKDVDGKPIRIPRHSLRTRIWVAGWKQLIDLAAPGGLAHKKEQALAEERRSRDVRLRRYLAYVQVESGSSGSCIVKLAKIAEDLAVPMATAFDNLTLAKELGYLEVARHGRVRTFTFTLTIKGREILPGRESGGMEREEAPLRRPPVTRAKGDYGALLRKARSASKKSRPAVVIALKKVGVTITKGAVKKHEEGKSLPRPAARNGYATVYGKSEQELFPGCASGKSPA